MQDELGLNFYDYGARNYDPALGRWMNIDPLSEKYVEESAYIYCGNNPVIFVDPDGRDRIYSATGKFLEDTGRGNLIRVKIGDGSYKLSELAYNKAGTNKAVSKIIAHEAAIRGYDGKYGVRNDKPEIGGWTDSQNDVYINVNALKKGIYDNYKVLGSTLDHEANIEFGHKGQKNRDKDTYKFLDHANVYLGQTQVSDFKDTGDDNKYSVTAGFMNRIYNAYKTDEISFKDLKTLVANFNKANKNNGVQIITKFDGNGVSVQLGNGTPNPIHLKTLEHPQD